MASLLLKITSFQSQTLGADAQKSFGQAGGSFGRGQSNDWVLPDPERVISTQHGVVSFRDGQYWLTDASTNGICIGNQSSLIGKGNAVVLNNGDVLAFGDYEIAVVVDDAGNGSRSNSGSTSTVGVVDSDALISSPNFDPLADSTAKTDTSPNDIAIASPGSQSDHSSALNDVFEVPTPLHDTALPSTSSEASGAAQIPEDWNLTGIFPAEPVPAVKASQSKAVTKSGGTQKTKKVAPKAAVNAAKTIPKPEKAKESAKTKRKPVTPKPEKVKPKTIKQTAVSASRPQKRADSSKAVPLSGNLFDLFIAGAGLDPADFTELNQAQAMSDFGGLFRDIIQGLMELLHARAGLKNEFKMSQTMIQPVENNPLKFSPNAGEALQTLLLNKNNSYLGPHEAIHESIDDVRSHQVAMIAGMQVAFLSLMERIEPNQFMGKNKDANAVVNFISGIIRKPQAWDKFSTFYQDTVVNSGDAFQMLFGKEYARAYEEQVSRLDRMKRNDRREQANESMQDLDS